MPSETEGKDLPSPIGDGQREVEAPVAQGKFLRRRIDVRRPLTGLVVEVKFHRRRILLSDDWEGHPLLKSYAVDTPHPPYR